MPVAIRSPNQIFRRPGMACIDSNASISQISFMPTITIRNLEERVKQRLRVLAAEHGRSMEAEARHILTRETLTGDQSHPNAASPKRGGMVSACVAVRGSWKGRMSTAEIMTLTRGE